MLAPFGIRPKGTLAVRMLPMAQALTRRGHQVTIIAPPIHNPCDAGQCHQVEGVLVHHTPLPRLPFPFHLWEYVARLANAVLSHPPDVLHLFKPKGYSGLAARMIHLRYPHLPLVVDTDDWEGWGGWNDLLPYPHLAKVVFAWQEYDMPHRAAAVTVASRTLQTQVWGAGVPPERVFYLPNGVGALPHLSPPPSSNRSPILLLYTRFWEFTITDLIAAFVAIHQHCPTVRLLVVGKGERGEEMELLRRAEHAGVAKAIDYVGWVEPTALPPLLTSADIALVPLDDTLINRARCSVKFLELMAYGLPIVAGRVGQTSEYLEDERSGLLVAPGHPAQLAQATLRLIADPVLRRRLGQAARERVRKHFLWDILVEEVERAYAYARSHAERFSRRRDP